MDKVDKAISKIKQISDDMLMDRLLREGNRLLSDMEIQKVFEYHCIEDIVDPCDRNIAKAQLIKTDREWIEWFEGICTKHKADNPDGFDQVIQMRMDCWECWEERKKEIGL